MKRHLLVLAVSISLAVPSHAKKKPPPPPPAPTQQDIISKCDGGNIVVANITYQGEQSRGLFITKHTGVYGSIRSSCTREGEVTIGVEFFNGHDVVSAEVVTKFVAPGDVIQFSATTEYSLIATGRVTVVNWNAIP